MTAVAPRRSAPAARLGEDAAERDADRRAERGLAESRPSCACGGGCPRCRPEVAGEAAPATAAASGTSAGTAVGTTDAPEAIAPALRSAGGPLGAAERAFMEPRLGADFGSVRVHSGPRADAAAAAVGAQAFAFGDHLVFAPGRRGDTRLLAHELAHVVQQRESGVRLQRSKVEGRASNPIMSGTAPPAPGKATPSKPTMDPKFWEWWKRILGYEGTLDDWLANPANKDDRGGETQRGITKDTYRKMAPGLGLDPSDAAFKAMTPEQAMRFGMALWKASAASRINNTGVAIVLGDWYWGGIVVERLTALLARHGFKATYDRGKPSKATTDFMNTLPPDQLLEEMSDEKAEQYKAFAKADPKQQKFLGGWLKRNEERREQARAFAPKPETQPPAADEAPQLDLWERAQRALRHARDAEKAEQRDAALGELAAVIQAIDRREAAGFAHAEEALALRSLREELKDARGRLAPGPAP